MDISAPPKARIAHVPPSLLFTPSCTVVALVVALVLEIVFQVDSFCTIFFIVSLVVQTNANQGSVSKVHFL